LSTHPDRMAIISPNMTSWFPLFFPLRVRYISSRKILHLTLPKHPLYLPSNSELHVSLWRLTDKKRVWYEWCAESFLPTPFSTIPAPVPILSIPTPGFHKLGVFNTPVRVASPLIDAASPIIVTSDFERNSNRNSFDSMMSQKAAYALTKIGQTALHNPGGRSSFIGL
jgi:type II protein arginine methyltransferase